MNVANLTDDELEICKNGTLHSNYPVVIKKGNLADYIGPTDGGMCLEFLQAKDVTDIERIYALDVDDCYDLTKHTDRTNYKALSKDALIFDIADSKSLELSQARSAEVFKSLVGRQIEEVNRADFKLKKREKLFEDFGVPISERPNDSLLKSEWLTSKKFLETGEIAKGFDPQRVNLSYYVQEDPALKAELTDLLADKVLKAIKPNSDSPKCFAETLERMTSMGFAGWPDNIPEDPYQENIDAAGLLAINAGYTVQEIIHGAMVEVIVGSPPLAIMAALTKVDPDNRKNPWAEAFLERAVEVFGDDMEVAVRDLTNLPENADTDRLLAPIQEFLPSDCKADLAVALIADGHPEIVEKLYSDKELRELVGEGSPFEKALQDRTVSVKIAVADALADLQAEHGQDMEV